MSDTGDPTVPVSADPPTTLERLPTPKARHKKTLATYQLDGPSAALASLETAMGGRSGLVEGLLHAPPSDAIAYVIGLIADPRNDARALPQLCADGGITIGELLDAYKQGAMARAQVAAIHTIAAHTPAVIADVMVRAAPHHTACPNCRGKGEVRPRPTRQDPTPIPVPCESCDATGQVYVAPDLDRQKFAADLAGLTPKKGAPLIDLSDRRTLSVAAATDLGGFAARVAGVDRVLYKEAPSPAGPRVSAADSPDFEVAGEAPDAILDAEVIASPAVERGVCPQPPPGRRPPT
jgi:hypothetical protein